MIASQENQYRDSAPLLHTFFLYNRFDIYIFIFAPFLAALGRCRWNLFKYFINQRMNMNTATNSINLDEQKQKNRPKEDISRIDRSDRNDKNDRGSDRNLRSERSDHSDREDSTKLVDLQLDIPSEQKIKEIVKVVKDNLFQASGGTLAMIRKHPMISLGITGLVVAALGTYVMRRK
jgi:hypothetical protein